MTRNHHKHARTRAADGRGMSQGFPEENQPKISQKQPKNSRATTPLTRIERGRKEGRRGAAGCKRKKEKRKNTKTKKKRNSIESTKEEKEKNNNNKKRTRTRTTRRKEQLQEQEKKRHGRYSAASLVAPEWSECTSTTNSNKKNKTTKKNKKTKKKSKHQKKHTHTDHPSPPRSSMRKYVNTNAIAVSAHTTT